MKKTIDKIENGYKLLLVAPAMLGLALIVTAGLLIFSWDKIKVKDKL